MTIYINDYPLTGYRVFKRTATDSWNILQRASDTMPYVEQTGQSATNYTLTMATSSTTRHIDAAALKAAIRDCNAIRLYSDTHYLYGASKHIWLAHTQLDVDEAGGPLLSLSLTGLIDPYTLSTCDFLTNWTCVGTALFLTPDRHTGRYGIAQYRAKGDNRLQFTYTPPQQIDLSKLTSVGFWVYSDTASSAYNSPQFNFSCTGGTKGWVISSLFTWDANTWTYIRLPVEWSSDSSSPDMARVSNLSFFLDTPAGTGNVYMCIDGIRWQ
jgi:hypothetical protein